MTTVHYSIKELAEAKGTSAPVRAALLALEARVLELEEINENLERDTDRCRMAMAVADNTNATLENEIDSLKAIVRGWHYLTVGPDEMGDYHTQKLLVQASEPYADPALVALLKKEKSK